MQSADFEPARRLKMVLVGLTWDAVVPQIKPAVYMYVCISLFGVAHIYSTTMTNKNRLKPNTNQK